MQVKIKSLHLENFKGAKNATYQLDGKNVSIMGANATGKTTIADSLWWLLFNKDSAGNEKFSIRPLDKDGKRIDNVEIGVSYVFDIDGKETVFEKTQKQNWVKKRGTSESVMQGNVNSYTVDGYPKSEKDYKARVSGISEEELFKILTNPGYLPGLKWDKQRSIILPLAGDISDIEIAKQDKRFANLIGELEKAPSTNDIKKKYQKALNEWKKKQAELPVRIDEAEKQKVDTDVAEQSAANKEKQEDISKEFEEQQKVSDGVLELKFELNDLQRKANEDLEKQRGDIGSEQLDCQKELGIVEKRIKRNKQNIEIMEDTIKKNSDIIKTCREDWIKANGRIFDENRLICQYCGQEFPTEKKEQLKAEFEKHKAEELEAVTKRGNELKTAIDNVKADIQRLSEEVEKDEKTKSELETRIAELETQYKEIPQSVDISDRPEVKEIQRQIAEKEDAMNKENSAEEIRQQLKAEGEELQKQMDAVKERFVLVKISNEADDRIAELQKEQREVAQKVADQEKMLYLLEEFIRFKMDSVSETINSQFEMVNFILFRNQINGGLAETCECEYGGVPYASLNSAAKIQCGLDIIRTLQKFHDVYCPVFVDNRESCTEIPKMDCQVISLYVEPSCKELKIEMEG